MKHKNHYKVMAVKAIKFFLPVMVIALGVLASKWFQESKVVKRVPKVKPYFQYVDAISVDKENVTPIIAANGLVKPTKLTVARTQVQGKVELIPETIIPGGFVKEGDLVAKIEDSTSRYDVQEAKAHIQKLQAQYQTERGKQLAAKYEYEMLNKELSAENEALVLRKPQLAQIKADLARAETDLKRAQLNLSRTKILAPFNAQIVARHVSVGSVVKDNTDLVELVATNAFWIEASVSMQDLSLINTTLFSKQRCVEENVTIAVGLNGARRGCVVSVLPVVEQKIKMARVLIALPDPLALEPIHQGMPPVLINDLVRVEIEGKPFESVYQVPRDYVQDDQYVWVMSKSETLERRVLDVLFTGKEHIVARQGFEVGDLLVTDFLTGAVEGTALKIRSDHPQSSKLARRQGEGQP